MTTAIRSARKPARVTCPHCTYTMDSAGSVPAHVAMAHPDVPIDTVAPRRTLTAPTPNPVPEAPAGSPTAGASLREIPLDLVDIGDNVRVTLEAIDELTASVAEHGVLQPVKATQLPDGRYRLVWGQRRVLAARKAGLATIPAIVIKEADARILLTERNALMPRAERWDVDEMYEPLPVKVEGWAPGTAEYRYFCRLQELTGR